MQFAHYELVARVGKTRGLEGKVTASAAGDLPFALYEGLEVCVVPPSLYGPRELTVECIDESSDNIFLVQFEGIDSIDDAEQIVGRYLLAKTDDLDPYDYEQYEEIGRSVIDERYGALGEIVEIIFTPANDVWVVNGAHGEVLIPVIEDVVLDIPEDVNESIRTRVMDGLVEE